jgi:hypothetical protein
MKENDGDCIIVCRTKAENSRRLQAAEGKAAVGTSRGGRLQALFLCGCFAFD